jgi:Rps23 Pro-64 3,4-dihydroxylase Tpa1-like proline 4-hydroxylase
VIPPINRSVLEHRQQLQQAFQADDPLPQFIVIPNFLRASLLRDVLINCRSARYSTFCAFSAAEDVNEIRNEFSEPNGDAFYLSVHERAVQPISALIRLRELLKAEETVAALSDLTGTTLTAVTDDLLTCWGPGSFLEQHTDYVAGSKVRLVLSLSLTTRWHPSYGGTTVFAWRALDRIVRLQPRLNTAVLFVPFPGSVHSVEQVSNNAPPRRRFTWTAFFA